MSGFTRVHALLAALLLLALTATYWNHFDNAFHFDDHHTIVDNVSIQDLGNLPAFFTDATTTSSLPTNRAYRPMITLLNAVDYRLAGGLDPRVFHAHIFAEFVVLLGLLCVFFARVYRAADGVPHPWLALGSAALFAFHTATAETINYIIARSDGFSTLMVLAGALVFVSTTGWRRQLGLIPFVVGCLAKPTTLMLAPILFVYVVVVDGREPGARLGWKELAGRVRGAGLQTLPYFVVGVAMYAFTRSMFADTWRPSNTSAVAYLTTQPYILWVYVKTFFAPVHLTADTDLGLIPRFSDPRVLWGLAVIAALVTAAGAAAIRGRTLPIAFGLAWFFLALIPSSSVVPLAEVMNHHRTFFPYIGLTMATVWAAHLAFVAIAGREPSGSARGVAALGTVAVLVTMAVGTYQRNEVWDSDTRLWHDVTEKSPGNGRGWMNYGLTQMRAGRAKVALNQFQRARATSYGNHPHLLVNLGIATALVARRTGDAARMAEAEAYFRQAMPMAADYPDVPYFYAVWLEQQGRTEEAEARVDQALRISPAHRPALALKQRLTAAKPRAGPSAGTAAHFLDLSRDHYDAGRYRECIAASRKALELDPDLAPAYNNICAASGQLGRYDEAILACERALQIAPGYARAEQNLAWFKLQRSE